MSRKNSDPTRLQPFRKGEKDIVNAVIETPMGSRNKFKYDEDMGFFALSGVLPQGMMFPHAFGFIPRTKAADGDPEDVLVILDEPVFPGCIVPSRLLGVIEAEQTEDGKTERNDRLIAVSASSRELSDVESLSELNPVVIKEIEKFFVNYNEERGKKFKVLARKGPQQAMKLLKKSLK
jgi:inorganic pyrophosphatase